MTEAAATASTSHIPKITSRLTQADRWVHFRVLWGINRGGWHVRPGLYALGNPSEDSPVFATANYILSFTRCDRHWTGSMALSWSLILSALTSGVPLEKGPCHENTFVEILARE